MAQHSHLLQCFLYDWFLSYGSYIMQQAFLNTYFLSISKIQSHNFTEIKYLHSCQNETLSKYQESKLDFFKEIHPTLDSKEILSSDWSWGSCQTLYILLQISWKLQTENCVSSRERERKRKFREDQNFWGERQHQ